MPYRRRTSAQTAAAYHALRAARPSTEEPTPPPPPAQREIVRRRETTIRERDGFLCLLMRLLGKYPRPVFDLFAAMRAEYPRMNIRYVHRLLIKLEREELVIRAQSPEHYAGRRRAPPSGWARHPCVVRGERANPYL